MRIYWFSIWRNLDPLHPRILCAKFGWNWSSDSGEEDFLNFINVFSQFRNYLPLEKGRALKLRNLNPLHPRMFCAKFGWNWSSGSGEEDFYIFVNIFYYFIFICPWKRAGPFIWTNLNPLYPRMPCAKFSWNWLSGSGEEDFEILVNIFSIFHNYLPLEKGGALRLKKLESPLPKDALCQV